MHSRYSINISKWMNECLWAWLPICLWAQPSFSGLFMKLRLPARYVCCVSVATQTKALLKQFHYLIYIFVNIRLRLSLFVAVFSMPRTLPGTEQASNVCWINEWFPPPNYSPWLLVSLCNIIIFLVIKAENACQLGLFSLSFFPHSVGGQNCHILPLHWPYQYRSSSYTSNITTASQLASHSCFSLFNPSLSDFSFSLP